jgi:hypothetical protein
MTKVNIPKGKARREKNARKVMPKIISGVIIGKMERYSNILTLDNLRRVKIIGFDNDAMFVLIRVIPDAPKVPIAADAKLVRMPRIKEFANASNMERSLKSSAYQYKLKPPHTELNLL